MPPLQAAVLSVLLITLNEGNSKRNGGINLTKIREKNCIKRHGESAVVFGQPLFARVMSHAEMLAFLSGEYRVSHADFLHDHTKNHFKSS